MRTCPTICTLLLICPAFAQNGAPDPAFSGDGVVVIDLSSGSNELAWDLTFQPDGKAVIVGTIGVSNEDFAVVRLNQDGSLDASFDGDGKVTTEVNGADDRGRAVVVQADGRIVVAGHARPGGTDDFALVRYNTDGSLDNSFDGDGRVVTDLGSDERALALLIQPDGRIVVCGQMDDGITTRFLVARYNTDGSPDPTFGGGTGYSYASFMPQDNATAWDLALQADGRIVVAGYASDGTYNDIAVARFHAYGTLDASFSLDGLVTLPVGPGHDIGHAVKIQPDGRIVIGGYAEDGSGGEQFIAIRLNTDGSLDNGFDGDGMVMTSVHGYDQAYGVVVQPDGRIVLGGYSHNGTQRVFSSVRYEADGALDLSYDGDGTMTLAIGSVDDKCYGAALAPNGGIALVGFSEGANAADFAVVMLLSGLNMGLLDPDHPSLVSFVHPNPVDDRTMLRFNLNNAAMIDCRLLDELGREVRTYFSGRTFVAGACQVELDLAGLAAGHYTVALSSGAALGSVRILKR